MILKTEHRDFVTIATVNRPEARNAVNFELMEQLERLLDDLEKDDQTRLFILTGTGESFISGGDLREFHQLKKAEEARRMTKRMIGILDRIENLPFWSLAAINGYAYGGGWETAAAFDFRLAHDEVKIGFTQGLFYLPPGWGGITRLSRLVGRSRALYWLASQQVIGAEEAGRSGFIDQYFGKDAFEDNLHAVAEKLTLNDREFIRYLKSSGSMTSQKEEIEPFSKFWESEEHLKRVEAFLNRKSR